LLLWKYGRDCPSATMEQTDAAYNEYKAFYATCHQDTTTDCYAEFLKTLDKQEPILDFKYDEKQYVAVKKAFSDSEYCNFYGVAKAFCQHVDKNMKKWDSAEYYSPYCALVQASAFGKPRLMVEVRKTLPVSYVCLRNEYSGGYPPHCPVADILTEERRLDDGTG
ncbi:11050_t:CDS:2, partial [Paraglomus occultum]